MTNTNAPDMEDRLRDAYASVQPDPSSEARLDALLDAAPPAQPLSRWRGRAIIVAAAALLVLLAAGLLERGRPAPEPPQPMAPKAAGTWQLVLERPGMVPETCRGVLVLEPAQEGGTWQGSLAFRRVLYARPHALSDIEVRGRKVAFAVVHPEFELRFDGKLRGDAISGRCAWKGLNTYDFTAERAEGTRRFEEGLRFGPDFRKGEPEKLGVDPARLDALVALGETAESSALLVTKDGKLLCERYPGSGADQRIHVMSVTKFVTALAVALLVEEEKIPSLDAPLSTWFPEWGEGKKAKVTLRHLLTHTSGIRHGETAAALNAAKDKVAYVRALPLDADPGTEFTYNNEAVALLSGILQEAAGKPVDDYVAEKVFRPLGIKDWGWDRDGAGRTITYAQLGMRARDLAKIGLLVLNGGRWKGRQVVPKAWIERLATPTSEVSPRMGLLWMVVREDDASKAWACYHTGWLGQWLVVLPEEKIVGVRLRRAGGRDAPELEFGSFLKLLRDLPAQ